MEVRRRIAVCVFGQRELRALVERPELLREFVASQAGSQWSGSAAPRIATKHTSSQAASTRTLSSSETDDLNDEIDDAYRGKYRRYAASIVDTVVTPTARAATLKLVPRS